MLFVKLITSDLYRLKIIEEDMENSKQLKIGTLDTAVNLMNGELEIRF